MRDATRRLARLEVVYQRPEEPARVAPFDPSLLTDDERTDLDAISAHMQTFDVGPGSLTQRADLRARLVVLDDDRLHRLGCLLRKAAGQERPEDARTWGMTA